MASRIVTRRQTTAGAVEAAAATHAAEVAAVLAPRLAEAAGEGEAPMDVLALQNRLGAVLRSHRQALEAADSAHIEELRDDIGPRDRRDAAVASLHDRVSRVRGTVETVFGAGASNRLFAIRGLTSRNPEVLRRQAERILARLRDESKPLPAPEVSWLAVDPAAWAAEIEPAHTELVTALREVYADRRRAETTFRLKQEALAAHNRAYVAVTSIDCTGSPDSTPTSSAYARPCRKARRSRTTCSRTSRCRTAPAPRARATRRRRRRSRSRSRPARPVRARRRPATPAPPASAPPPDVRPYFSLSRRRPPRPAPAFSC